MSQPLVLAADQHPMGQKKAQRRPRLVWLCSVSRPVDIGGQAHEVEDGAAQQCCLCHGASHGAPVAGGHWAPGLEWSLNADVHTWAAGSTTGFLQAGRARNPTRATAALVLAARITQAPWAALSRSSHDTRHGAVVFMACQRAGPSPCWRTHRLAGWVAGQDREVLPTVHQGFDVGVARQVQHRAEGRPMRLTEPRCPAPAPYTGTADSGSKSRDQVCRYLGVCVPWQVSAVAAGGRLKARPRQGCNGCGAPD